MNYKTKLEAYQYDGDLNGDDTPIWIIEALKNDIIYYDEIKNGLTGLFLDTPDGGIHIAENDYIVNWGEGRLNVFNPGIFKQNYEKCV